MEVRLSLQNVPVLFLILTVQQLSIRVSSVPEGLERLVIERRRYSSDLFTLHFGRGPGKCTNRTSAVSQWCKSLNANFNGPGSMGNKICSCTCKDAFRTFLPQKQECVNSTGAKKFGGK